MNATSFSFVLTGVMLNAVAQLCLKAATRSTGEAQLNLHWFTRLGLEPYFLLGLLCYAASVLVWVVALSKVQVSIAYPMLSIGYVANIALAYWWFGEPITAAKLAGVTLIVAGVIVLYRA